MLSSIASAPGKCILFGEHAVVYGYPSIALAINIRSYCKITENKQKGISLILKNYNKKLNFIDLHELSERIPPKYTQIAVGLDLIRKNYNISIKDIEIILNSDLWPEAGLGSSASTSVAFLAALSDYYKLKLKKEEISEFAYKLEKIVHGKPSGIDNTICSQGGAILYEKHKFQKIEFDKNLQVLVTYSGKTHNTKKAIENVKDFYINSPKISIELFKKIKKLTLSGISKLEKGNFREIGNLMTENQQILYKFGLSSPEIKEIVQIATSNNAFGSKLTGAGMGGCVISIGNLSVLQIIKEKLKKLDYPSIITSINNQGVIIGQ